MTEQEKGIREFGRHMMLSVYEADPDKTDVDNIKKFIGELLERIELKAASDCLASSNVENGGVIVTALLETNMVSVAQYPEKNDLCIDIFSTKPFHEDKVIWAIEDFFKTRLINFETLERR